MELERPRLLESIHTELLKRWEDGLPSLVRASALFASMVDRLHATRTKLSSEIALLCWLKYSKDEFLMTLRLQLLSSVSRLVKNFSRPTQEVDPLQDTIRKLTETMLERYRFLVGCSQDNPILGRYNTYFSCHELVKEEEQRGVVERVLIDICHRGLKEYPLHTSGRAEGSAEFVAILNRIRGNHESLKSSPSSENAHTERIKIAIESLYRDIDCAESLLARSLGKE